MNTDIFRWLVITLLWMNLAVVAGDTPVLRYIATGATIAAAAILTAAVIEQARWERRRKQDRSWDLNR